MEIEYAIIKLKEGKWLLETWHDGLDLKHFVYCDDSPVGYVACFDLVDGVKVLSFWKDGERKAHALRRIDGS